MKTPRTQNPARLAPLVFAWLGLFILTLLSLGLGEWLRGASWLAPVVASIVWLKAWLVAYFFLETPHNHRFIRRITWSFIAFAPIALVLTDQFGREFANWAQL